MKVIPPEGGYELNGLDDIRAENPDAYIIIDPPVLDKDLGRLERLREAGIDMVRIIEAGMMHSEYYPIADTPQVRVLRVICSWEREGHLFTGKTKQGKLISPLNTAIEALANGTFNQIYGKWVVQFGGTNTGQQG